MKLKFVGALLCSLVLTSCVTIKPKTPLATVDVLCLDYRKVYEQTGVKITEAMPNFDYEAIGSFVLFDYGGYITKEIELPEDSFDKYEDDLYVKRRSGLQITKDYHEPSALSSAIEAAKFAKSLGADYIINLKFHSDYTESPNAKNQYVKYVSTSGMAVKRE